MKNLMRFSLELLRGREEMKRLLIIILIFALLLTSCGKIEESECHDPGPPVAWHFYSVEDYYALEKVLAMGNDEELEAFADEKRFDAVYSDYDSLRETAEQVCSMVREIAVLPQVEGYNFEFMKIVPEKDRLSMFVQLTGEGAIHVLYTFDEEIEKEWIENLGKREHEAVENPNVDKLYLTERDINIEGTPIYRFGCMEEGMYVRIFLFELDEETARATAGKLYFTAIK